MKKQYLSKSKLLKGWQCHKNIYLHVNKPELEAKMSESQKAIFEQGVEVGVVARKQFPKGVLVKSYPWDQLGSFSETLKTIKSGARTIFEGTFLHENYLVKVDILHRNEKTDEWELIEVKSSTKIKEENIDDLSIQAWVLKGAGLNIQSYKIMHLNSDCRYPNLNNLFQVHDVTENILGKINEVPLKLAEIKKTLSENKVPDIDVGPHCEKPYECSFKDHCWKERGISNFSIFNLPKIGNKKWDFYKNGQINIDQVSIESLNELQARVVNAVKTNNRYINPKAIHDELSEWIFPLYYLDFETISYAIPKYKGTGPYTQVPFQYSCHIELEDKSIKHVEFLNTVNDDPRLRLIESLLSNIGEKGNVVSYYKTFEEKVIKHLAEVYPEFSQKLLNIADRLVDPLPVLQKNVYDNAFEGSFSLKNVGPALIGESISYKNLNVRDGSAAQRAYTELIECKLPEKKSRIEKSMLEYCKLDTFTMVELVRWLRNV